MKNFVKMTKLTAKSGGIKGRAEYISDKERQENLIYASEPVDWKSYRSFEKKNQKSNTPNNEGRELIIALPNEWDNLPVDELTEKTKCLAELAIDKNTDYQFAIHYNSSKTNLHVHVIFSERSMTDEVDYYKKDVFLQEDGKVARAKKDRAKDEFGNELPAVHKKGDIKNAGFTAKDKRYTQKGWLEDTKNRIADHYKEQGIDIEQPKVFELHQYHEGKGSESEFIKQKNEVIKTANDYLALSEKKGVSEEKLISQKQSILKYIFANKITEIKGRLDNIIKRLQPEKREPVISNLSEEKERSRPTEPEFQPFTQDEIKVYQLYQTIGETKDFIKSTEKELSQANYKLENYKKIIRDTEPTIEQWEKLQQSRFRGQAKADKFKTENKMDFEQYRFAQDNIGNTERKVHELTNHPKFGLNANKKALDNQYERLNKLLARSPNPMRIEEKDALSGKPLDYIEKSLKSKNKPLEFEPSPEKTPYRQQSLSDALKDAKKSADEYNRNRNHRSRSDDFER